jgi:oligopeptide/dipeptide ABC transporter ATP-binding protein
LKKYFSIKGGVFSKTIGYVHAIDGINFTIDEGKTLGLVGESGCGKTTVGRCMLRLIEPTGGRVLFDGMDILKLKGMALRKMRRDMQIVFQDPFSSLNPRMIVKDIIGEPLVINKLANGSELRKKVLELMEMVGLGKEQMNRYPHEFSGGQRQRICIAKALALNPKILVLDEPTSALDVSVQAQILNLLEDLQRELHLTYLFISHDLSVIRHVSDHIVVMYMGKIMEIGEVRDIYENPLNPYTKALLSAIPGFKKERIILKGEVPSPINPPSGCRFEPRCQEACEICRDEEPKLIDVGSGHFVACHFPMG